MNHKHRQRLVIASRGSYGLVKSATAPEISLSAPASQRNRATATWPEPAVKATTNASVCMILRFCLDLFAVFFFNKAITLFLGFLRCD